MCKASLRVAMAASRSDAADDAVARVLSKKVRVLCWIMTAPQFLQTKARHVRATWGRRCTVLLFASDYEDPNFPTIDIHVKPGRRHLTAKSMQTFDYVYKHHIDDADWFLKADDDTYVIMENLRYMLKDLNSSAALALGRVWNLRRFSYFSGGAGYVMSKETLRRFGQRSPDLCNSDLGAEDIKVSTCMARLGVTFVDSIDTFHKSRFHAYTFSSYNKNSNNTNKMGVKSVSDLAVSFHYVKPDTMYELEYYLYRLRPYGLLRGDRPQLNPTP
ncbi:Glycoprotein-N-acetylgalactosamine 3-beta-galactosyltransferase 1 [Lamellibrachia satsuma]|nr:Glycoprotein-N-acetylgalactosamine 3-beta-galactosyltransferase 1 [Lamellibrachia satsuma]